jgi:hypothetical protein
VVGYAPLMEGLAGDYPQKSCKDYALRSSGLAERMKMEEPYRVLP